MVNAGQNLPMDTLGAPGRGPPMLFSLSFPDRLDWHADRMGVREAVSSGAHA
jgi:hypothetical protein